MTTPQPELRTAGEVDTAVVRGVVPMAELPAFFDRSFSAVGGALAGSGTAPVGPAFAFYPRPPQETAELEVGFPVDAPVEARGDVVPSRLPGGRRAVLVHRGGYEGLGESWGRLMTWVSDQGLQPAQGFWEVYVTEPAPGGDPAENRTELVVPLRD